MNPEPAPEPDVNPEPAPAPHQVSKANDATRRKSVLPGGKNDESKAQVAVVATGDKLQTTYQADNES